MIIGGLQKTTLIDFPGRVACTVFTVGCNFRCPFCHNKDLVTLKNFRTKGLKELSEKDFFEFLEKRKRILDGVTITGGEPTLQLDLPEFCKRIKDLGFEVKVDTNGSNPEMLERLIDRRLVDYIAMDIKTAFEEYSKAVKSKKQKACPPIAATQGAGRRAKSKNTEQNLKLIGEIKKSIAIILKSGLEYEFRTTVVPGIHNERIMIRLARDLKSLATSYPRQKAGRQLQAASINWVLQNFRPQNCLDPAFLKIEPFTKSQMQDILKLVRQTLPGTRLRGIN